MLTFLLFFHEISSLEKSRLSCYWHSLSVDIKPNYFVPIAVNRLLAPLLAFQKSVLATSDD